MALALLIPAGVGAARAAAPRVEKTINRDWTFQYFPEPKPDLAPAAPGFDDATWPAVAVPHTWSTFETTRDLHPFIRAATERIDTYWWYGWGWYRKKFSIGSEHASRLVFLEFDGVQKYAKIYLNGESVAEHKGGYTSFSVDVTKHVKFGAENVLAVQVSNRRDDSFGVIPPSTAGNFDVYGGIYRDVRLVLTDKLHVPFQGSAEHEGGTFVTTPEIDARHAAVRVRTWVQNDHTEPRPTTLVTTVRDAEDRIVLTATARATLAPGELHEFDQPAGVIASPRLWSPDVPYLYRVSTEVRDGDRLADTFASPLGLRWFSWNKPEKRLYLNGQKIVLHGTNRHQEFPWLGDAMPKWMHREDLEVIRHDMGLNFQRTVHYPNDPFVYAECDRLGFLLIEEACAIKDIAFGRDIQKQIVQEMIRRDRNHPSIVMWSMGNETNQPADSAWGAAEDPTRLIYLRRSDNGGDHVDLTDKDLAIENLLRCTARGWLNDDDHDFGAQGPHPSGAQVTGTEEWQHEKTRESPKLADDNVVTWLYADHGADREYLNSPLLNINPKGWVDAYRFPKLAFYIWPANFTTKPMAFIHPTWWRPQYLGSRREIRVDSNCDEVELKLDGRSLGKQTPTSDNAHSVIFAEVEVRRGTLTIIGRKGGAWLAQPLATLAMAGPPTRLVLTTAQKQIPADRAGIAVLKADIVDAAGVHVYGANPPLTWAVSGPATLVGPEHYETDTKKNGALDGTMYIDLPVANVLRSTATPGEIRVRVSAPGLAPAEVALASVAPEAEVVAGITEPAVRGTSRIAVLRDPNFKPAIVAAKNRKLAEINQDAQFTLSAGSYREQVEAFIRAHAAGVDPFSADYRALVERLVAIVTERNGLMIADDYNFNVRAFNDQLGAKTKKKK
jgi:hypothetical protein